MNIEPGRILYALPGLVWTALPNGRIDFVNRQWAEYTGLGLDEAHGGEWQSVVHPDDLPALLQQWQSMYASLDSAEIGVRLRRFDGVYRRFVVKCSPVLDNAGHVERWCGIATDVECQQPAEGSLLEQTRMFQRVVDSIPMPVAVTSPTGDVEWLNQPTLDYFGKTLEKLKDWKASDVVHPDDLERTIAAQLDAHRQGISYDVESRHLRADGVYRWYNVLGLPLRDPDGKILRWFHLLIDIDDRKQAEEALQQAERQSRTILDNIATLVSLLDANGVPKLINRQIVDYTGRTEAQLKRWGGSDLVHPDDVAGATAYFEKGIASGEPFEIVYRMRRFDGEYRWFQGRHRPLRDNAGNVEQWCVSVDDIEDRKRVEESLRAAELDARLAMDSVDGMICVFTADGVLNGGNRQLLDYFQMPLEEVMKWATNGITHPDDLQYCIDTFMASVASGEPYDFETRFRRFDGVYRWFRLRGLPLRNAEGQIVRWYGLLTDIDDRKHTEEELKHSEMLLAEGQRMSQSGTFSWIIETDKLTFSDELNRIFGFATGATITFEDIQSRVHPEDLPMLAEKMAEVRSGQDNPEYEIRLLMPDGATKHLRVIGRLVDWQHSGRLECIGAVQDITERKLAERARDELRSELAHVARVTSLGEMAASIAHEVNQPLSGIITNASTSLRMLAANPPNLEGARETARRTIRDGNRAADVITRLRALFSKRVSSVEHIDLNDAVREVVALCWSDLQLARASLRTELAEWLPPVSGDRVQLQQVVVNLLRNSADAVAADDNHPRQIVLATSVDGEGSVCLSVSDSGVGFRSDDPERLFDAFYSTKSDGMGIGLSVSRTIVESHGGRLWAEANEGPGATFRFSIPTIDGQLTATSDAGRPASSAARP